MVTSVNEGFESGSKSRDSTEKNCGENPAKNTRFKPNSQPSDSLKHFEGQSDL